MGSDYDGVTGTMSWEPPLPASTPYFVAPVCFPGGTDPDSVLSPNFLSNPNCTNPACWTFAGGPCGNFAVRSCFQSSTELWVYQ